MKTWVFASQKGGNGKSTLATQIAVYAQSQHGARVAVVDMDPQLSAMAWGKLRGNAMPEVIKSDEFQLAQIIKAAAEMGYTLLIVDTAPHTRSDTVAAIRAADMIVCPTKSSFFDMEALANTVLALEYSNRLRDAVGVVNCITPSKPGAMVAEYDAAVNEMLKLGLKACANYVCHRKAFIDAIASGQGVTESHKSDKAAKEIIALYDELKIHEPSNVVRMKGRA